jgi:hypothetical protein
MIKTMFGFCSWAAARELVMLKAASDDKRHVRIRLIIVHFSTQTNGARNRHDASVTFEPKDLTTLHFCGQ